jgi:hypothetical protein
VSFETHHPIVPRTGLEFVLPASQARGPDQAQDVEAEQPQDPDDEGETDDQRVVDDLHEEGRCGGRREGGGGETKVEIQVDGREESQEPGTSHRTVPLGSLLTPKRSAEAAKGLESPNTT